MLSMKTVSFIFIAALGFALMNGCGPKNYEIYTGPPVKNIDLDTVVTNAGPFRHKPPPDSLTASVLVPGEDSCHVIVDLHMATMAKIRTLADTILAPGRHDIRWQVRDKKGIGLKINRHYYYTFYICSDTSTAGFDFRTSRF